ncbi:peptidoglycan -binding protein [Thalassospira sp. ER-Se-21-Dark]|uniref:peptidoglycan -binding protein n=1 Tax=Thalassospira sp. ER-Se-21-Dark TaxID=2585190 RepID=UPI001B309A04|nr:peptidoglycan -binding protein [Thalassospira sp. ER-Se-21-Dark]MBP3126023.1 peptidoglycan -binding protein [Thalassospira sp. ER-Se-21-Dark]
MIGLSRRRNRDVNTWPGFVDALATLLMVIIFLLMIFVIAQVYLGAALSGRDEALSDLTAQVNELTNLLSLERGNNQRMELELTQLTTELSNTADQRDELRARAATLADQLAAAELSTDEIEQKLLAALASLEDKEAELTELRETTGEKITDQETRIDELSALLASRAAELEEQKNLSDEAKAQVAALNQQMLALRQQLARIEAALETSERENEEKDAQIVNLGNRLNAALATKVAELQRYRSEFFGRLREVLGDRQDIRVVGDRFVFQSEVLFGSGEAELGEEGKDQLAKLGETLTTIAADIPDDIDWVMRVDGHTDKVPIRNLQFASNWELSAARAISVVKFLIDQGVPPNRLVAAGFGEYQPLDNRDDEIAYRRNRRIEFKITER